MRSRIVEGLVIIIIFFLILGLIIYALQDQDRKILEEQDLQIEFTVADRAYMTSHDTVRISVEDDLAYLIDGGEGYLPDYLSRVLEPSGLKPVFVSEEDGKQAAQRQAGEDVKAGEKEEADETGECSLKVVTPRLRDQSGKESFTSPLFQVEGRIFVREDQNQADSLKICIQPQRLTNKKLENMEYRDKSLDCSPAASAADLVTAADEGGYDGIIGDRGNTEYLLREQGLQTDYVMAEKALYTYNVCLMVSKKDAALYDIINQCIQACDRHNLTYEMSQKWLEGNGPVYLQRSRQTSYLPVIIIILSVLIAFSVYYLTNRGMYRELSVRMDQITESRNEMQTTFHGVGHYMAELTTSGIITDLNQAFAGDLTGPALSRSIWEVLDLDDEGREHVRQMVEHAAEGNQDPRFETNIGSGIFVIDIFPVEGAHKEVGRLLFMAIDVTQERMAKRQMLQDNKMIAIGQLAAGVAHEIRNPLGIIRNYCYVLKTMENEEIRAKAIEEIEKAVETSGGIINNLLDFSRVSPGRRETIDVEQHIRTLLSLNEATFRSSGIELIISCPQPVTTWISIEPFDMILLNLVKNAADAIEAKAEPGEINIAIRQISDQRFTIEVRDNGIGIKESALEEIYNPFYSTKGNKGTGLGLYIVYSETEKLDGEIDVSSVPGEGTTFRLSLPIRYQEEEIS